MAVDERRRSVVFAEEAAVDIVESVAGNEPVPAGGTRETLGTETRSRMKGTALRPIPALSLMPVRDGVYLEMVDVALCPHHQLAGRDGLTAGTAGAAVSK